MQDVESELEMEAKIKDIALVVYATFSYNVF